MPIPWSRRSLLAVGAALLVSACATRPSLVAPPLDQAWPELEPLLAVTAGAKGLTIRVASKGCARKEDFVFHVERKGAASAVAFARKRLEPCRAPDAPPVDLTFSYEELGVRPRGRLSVLNPLPGN